MYSIWHWQFLKGETIMLPWMFLMLHQSWNLCLAEREAHTGPIWQITGHRIKPRIEQN